MGRSVIYAMPVVRGQQTRNPGRFGNQRPSGGSWSIWLAVIGNVAPVSAGTPTYSYPPDRRLNQLSFYYAHLDHSPEVVLPSILWELVLKDNALLV